VQTRTAFQNEPSDGNACVKAAHDGRAVREIDLRSSLYFCEPPAAASSARAALRMFRIA
jgi:hypothetical protein